MKPTSAATRNPQPASLLILGMHRSGTSALARVINLLGVELGNQLMQAASDNPKGFFEHEKVVQVHEQLLAEIGSQWYDGTPLPEGWAESEAAKRANAELARIIDTDFKDTTLWGLKDPRLSRFVPLWLPLLQQRDISPLTLVAWRHPSEVVKSLQTRDDMNAATALLCWIAYSIDTLQAYAVADVKHRAIVAYDDLLEDWQECVKKMGQSLSLQWPNSPETVKPKIDGFLSRDLRHHHTRILPEGAEILHPLTEQLIELYNDFSSEKLQQATLQWHQLCAAFAPLLSQARLEANQLSTQLNQAQKQAAKSQHKADDLQMQLHKSAEINQNQTDEFARNLAAEQQKNEAEQRKSALLTQQLEQIQNSTSWKLTAPLRDVRRVVTGNNNHSEAE